MKSFVISVSINGMSHMTHSRFSCLRSILVTVLNIVFLKDPSESCCTVLLKMNTKSCCYSVSPCVTKCHCFRERISPITHPVCKTSTTTHRFQKNTLLFTVKVNVWTQTWHQWNIISICEKKPVDVIFKPVKKIVTNVRLNERNQTLLQTGNYLTQTPT